MPCAAPVLALVLVVAALPYPAVATPQPPSAEALAARLLGASETQRQQLLGAPEFASVEVARALLAVGDKALQDFEVPRAAVAFGAAEAVAARAGAEPERGRALMGAANALGARSELLPALRMVEQALRVFERLGDAAGQAEAWNSIGHNKWALAEYPVALEAYRSAHRLWTSAGDRRGTARALNNIGNVHRAVADFDEAIADYEQALAVFQEIEDRMSAAVVTNNIGLIHFFRGEYPLALEYCQRGLAMKEALGDRWRISGGLDSLGNIHRARGAYALALDYFHRALKIRQELGDKFATLETWNNIGLVYSSEGKYALAIDAYKRGLRLNKEMGGTTLVTEGLNNIAAAAWGLGQRRRAEANYRESLRVSERVGNKAQAAESLHGLARMALQSGRHAEASALLERALAMREGLKDKAGMAEALNGLAAVSLAVGRPAAALAHAGRAAGIARTFEQRERHWEAETLSGIAYRRLGQADAARRSFEAAVDVVEGLRLEVAGGERGGERFFEGKLSPYQELMTLALERGSAAEALELAERSKARVLADLVHRGGIDAPAPLGDEERREEDRLRAALVSTNRALHQERLKDTPDEARLASLEADQQVRRSAYETFQAAVHAKHPELALHRGRASSFELAQAGSLLPRDSVALLEYAVTETDSYLFVLTTEAGVSKLDAYALGAGRASLAPRTRRLRERLAARDLAFAEDARQLYDLLLGPARARLEGKAHLVVVPDGPLWEVPFQALQDGAGRYLIESAAVSYAPSLTVLRESLRRPRPAAAPRLLAMGKSEFGAKAARPALSLMSDLGPLPDAERQVRLIGALYGPSRSTAYLGAEAREDTFKAEAPRHSVIHLATHGVLDETSPLYSHVVLSAGSGGSSADGLLEAWEMTNLGLDADLVVLSACETGRGRIAPGEGIVGTTWALLVAGSRALLVSQWKVESASTTELMTAFHRGLARGEGGKAQHLRSATLELLRRPRYAHPFYWAGFVLVGNPY